MRRLRTIPLRIVQLVLLGAATTVVVAWLLGVLLPHRGLEWRRNLVGTPAQYITVFEFTRAGMARRAWRPGYTVNTPGLWDALLPYATIRLHGKTATHDRSWGDLPKDLAHPTRASQGAEDARGWPFLCLWCTLDENVIEVGATGSPVRGGIAISRVKASTTAGSFRALPLFPIWRGLAMNTVIYAGAWAVLIPAFRMLRATVRRRRGLCPRCAYNLNRALSGGCPECGWHRGMAEAVIERS